MRVPADVVRRHSRTKMRYEPVRVGIMEEVNACRHQKPSPLVYDLCHKRACCLSRCLSRCRYHCLWGSLSPCLCLCLRSVFVFVSISYTHGHSVSHSLHHAHDCLAVPDAQLLNYAVLYYCLTYRPSTLPSLFFVFTSATTLAEHSTQMLP